MLERKVQIEKLEHKIEEIVDSDVTIEQMDELLDEMEELIVNIHNGPYLVK